MYQFLAYSVANRVAYITLNRPEKRNALNDVLVRELTAACQAAEADGNVKVVVLRANGKAFCAGADLEYLQRMQSFTQDENLADSSALAGMFLQIYQSSKVYIAQIEGHAIAGGCGLASVCDFSFAVPEAKFGYTEVRIGFVPAIVAGFALRKMGETRTKELLLSGDLYTAEQVASYNLITKVVPAVDIQQHVQSFAERLCNEASAASLQLTKRLIGDVSSFSMADGVTFAARLNAIARGTDDCKRGIASFLNKEEIVW